MVAFIISLSMRVISVKTIKLFYHSHKTALQPLLCWYEEIRKASWKNHNELKTQFSNASIINTKRVVFNIHGNHYRLIVDIEYRLGIVFVVWIGSHKDYDRIDSKTITYVKAN